MDQSDKNFKMFLANLHMQEDELLENLNTSFSKQDLARLTTLVSMYEPLLNNAQTINEVFLRLHNQNAITLDKNIIEFIERWLQDFQALNELTKSIATSETIH